MQDGSFHKYNVLLILMTLSITIVMCYRDHCIRYVHLYLFIYCHLYSFLWFIVFYRSMLKSAVKVRRWGDTVKYR